MGDDTNGTATADPGPTVTATVTAEPEPAPTVTVTETVPQAEPEAALEPAPDSEAEPEPADDQTAGGLDALGARFACADVAETALKNAFPASNVTVHKFMGVLAETYRADTDDWFIKIEASVDNNRLNVECYVSGTEIAPMVDELLWY